MTLAASGDTTTFGIGEWATVFATATNPDWLGIEPERIRRLITQVEI